MLVRMPKSSILSITLLRHRQNKEEKFKKALKLYEHIRSKASRTGHVEERQELIDWRWMLGLVGCVKRIKS